MREEDIAINRAIGRHGAPLVPDGKTVLTHCNAGALATAGYGTALGVIRAAVEAGKKIDVFADETRPFLQGARLTVWELQQDGIPATLITDNMAGHFLKSGRIGCVVVGADRIAANGDVANKIGTYSVAVLAKENGVPFYVAAPISTLDLTLASGDQIPIEQRAAGRGDARLRACASRRTARAVENPAFDVTPEPLRDGHHHRARRGARALRGIAARVGRIARLMRALVAILLCAASLFARGRAVRTPRARLLADRYQREAARPRRITAARSCCWSSCRPPARTAPPLAEILEAGQPEVRGKGGGARGGGVSGQPGRRGAASSPAHKIRYPMLFDCGQVTASYYKATPANASVALPARVHHRRAGHHPERLRLRPAEPRYFRGQRAVPRARPHAGRRRLRPGEKEVGEADFLRVK